MAATDTATTAITRPRPVPSGRFSFLAPLAAGYGNRWLVVRMSRREIEARFKGSLLGILWSILTPLLMLGVYTFVFSVVMKARWGGGGESRGSFALQLFSGLIVFNIFAEAINRSPTLLIENVSYIKKIVFPLDALAWVVLLSSLFNAAVSLLIWLVFYGVSVGVPPWTAVLFPLTLLPLCLLTLGLTWFLSSLGVFLRDARHMVAIFTQMLMFVSPVFFPKSAVPMRFQAVMNLNPLTLVLEQAKGVLLLGQLPDWKAWLALTAASWVVCMLGHAWFQRTRKAFADVI